MWIWDNMILPLFRSLFQTKRHWYWKGWRWCFPCSACSQMPGATFIRSLLLYWLCVLHCTIVSLGLQLTFSGTQFGILPQQKVFWCLLKWVAFGRCGLSAVTLSASQGIGMGESKVCILLKGLVKGSMHEPSPLPHTFAFLNFLWWWCLKGMEEELGQRDCTTACHIWNHSWSGGCISFW